VSPPRVTFDVNQTSGAQMSLETLGPVAVRDQRAAHPAEIALTRRIDLTTLRLFIAICDEQNLTRAAAREGIAASAVSKRMNDFELAFGVTLFRRLPHAPATPTSTAPR